MDGAVRRRTLTHAPVRSHDPLVSRAMTSRWLLPLLSLAVACGGDDGAGSTSTNAATTTESSTGAGESSTGDADGSTSDAPGTTTSGTDPSDTVGPTTTMTTDPTTSPGDSSSGGTAAGACTPDGIYFGPQGSISFDFGAQSCTMIDATGTDPQLVFDIRDTGLTDITAMGMSISSSTTGTYVNPQAVVGISPDVPTTVQATNDADGSPVTLLFVIQSKGPFLDADVTFGE